MDNGTILLQPEMGLTVNQNYMLMEICREALQKFSLWILHLPAKFKNRKFCNTSYPLQGSLDEVAMHNVELTSLEIQQHYSNGLGGLGYYESTPPAITSTAPSEWFCGSIVFL